MKIISALSILLFCFVTHAQTATVLGIPDGTYTGSDTLHSHTWFVPDVDFSTRRVLQNNTITAVTKAFLFGQQVGGAAARLRIKNINATQFVMEDLDAPDAKGGFLKAGEGSCNAQSCSFSATVMKGSLQLKETWVRAGANEFHILNGWQNLSGKVGTYTGRLVRSQ
jgi:hypothetical protein